MRLGGVEEWEIEHILRFPAYILKYPEGTMEAYGELRHRKLKVVYEDKEIAGEKYKRIVSVQFP